MLCDICKNKDATYHLKQTRQGKVSEYHLCEQCAKEQGVGHKMKNNYSASLFNKPTGIGNIFHPAGGIPEFGRPESQNIVCSECGHSYQDFRRTGLFGCSQCYQAFADRLEPVFRRVQGNVKHKGSAFNAPEQNKLSYLRSRLKKLVDQEAYEEAAKIRDEINAIKKKAKREGE